MNLIEQLQAIIANPDDLTQLPKIIEEVQALQGTIQTAHEQEATYQERINKLQEINRAYLAQIPIAGIDPQQQKTEEQEPTVEDATAYLISQFTGGNE